MTEPEWQELSDFLAREIMGWVTWSDGHDSWWRKPEQGRGLECKVSGWQPHNNVAQAMSVLNVLLVKAGKHAVARISIRPPPGHCLVTIHNWVKSAGAPASLVRSPYVDNEMQAICLAAKEWCDVQTAKTLA